MKRWFILLAVIGLLISSVPTNAATISLFSLDGKITVIKQNLETMENTFAKKGASLPVSISPYLSNSLFYDSVTNTIKLKGDVPNPGPNMMYGTDANGVPGWYPAGSVAPPTAVANPQFNPVAGTYGTAQNVTITSATSGAAIRYTTDGSDPTPTVGTIYTSAINVATTTTLKAIAYKSGMTDSQVISATYTIGFATVATPTFNPVEGTYSSAQDVTISTSTSGATIRYTTDGSDPTPSTGNVYSAPVNIASTSTLKAIAYKSGMNDSAIATGVFTINATMVANPVLAPPADTYGTAQNITITSATSGATIRYTTNGTTPSSTVGTIYAGPVAISTTTTLKAIAYKSGMADSNVVTGLFTIAPEQVTFIAPSVPGTSGIGVAGTPVTITPPALDNLYRAFICMNTNTLGSVGDIYTSGKTTSSFNVYCTGSNTTASFDWFIVRSDSYLQGSDTYSPTGTTITLPSTLANTNYRVLLQANSATGGGIGDVYVTNKTTSSFKVYCTGQNFGGATFDWAVVLDADPVLKTGSNSFTPTTGTSITIPDMGNTNYKVLITPSANTLGAVGDIYLSNKTNTGFKVMSTGSGNTSFDYVVVP